MGGLHFFPHTLADHVRCITRLGILFLGLGKGKNGKGKGEEKSRGRGRVSHPSRLLCLLRMCTICTGIPIFDNACLYILRFHMSIVPGTRTKYQSCRYTIISPVFEFLPAISRCQSPEVVFSQYHVTVDRCRDQATGWRWLVVA